MSQEKLNRLVILSIEKEMLEELKYKNLIRFCISKSKKNRF